MSSPTAPRSREDFKVAVICALPLEAENVQAAFDRCWDDEGRQYGKTAGDQNEYTTGVIGRHNVVLVHMPDMGTVHAAQVAVNLRSSYPAIRLAVVVGICGVAPIHPETHEEIVLGDVVVSTAVVQYDFGRQYPDNFQRKQEVKDSLGRANPVVRALINKLQTRQNRQRITTKLTELVQFDGFREKMSAPDYPGASQDWLYEASYVHQHRRSVDCSNCDNNREACSIGCHELGCDEDKRIMRNRYCHSVTQETNTPGHRPVIHFGRFGSASTVMKSGSHRDALTSQDKLAAFEMEGAGVWEQHPTVIIKAACDYADSHKNKAWQAYAAYMAAVCLKVFLQEWVTVDELADSEEPRSLGLCLASAPPIQSSDFVGRNAEIDTIHNRLWPATTRPEQRQVVLEGIGGVGKTQLAVAYARKYEHSYASVLWLNATSEMTLYKSFRSVAEQLTTVDELRQLDNEQVLERVRRWLSHVGNTRWLLIFDNHDEPFDLYSFRPDTSHGSIIITTRRLDLVSGSLIRLAPLRDIGDSLDVLQQRSGRQKVKDDPGAHRLAERLAGLPLALVTAGAYLHRNSITFQEYLDAYEQRWQVDRRRPLHLQEYQDRTLYTTWDLSYIRLQSDDPEAAQMLKLLAYFDNQEIWYELFQAGRPDHVSAWLPTALADRIDFGDVMRTLVEYCLVDVQDTGQYSMHSCVHDWTLGALNTEIDAQRYWYAFDCVASSIDLGDSETLEEVRHTRLSRHAVRLTHHRFESCGQLGSSLSERGNDAIWIALMLQQQVQLKAAERMYLRALAGYEEVLGVEHASTLNTVNNLGALYHDQGRLVKAEQMYERALAGREKKLGAEHISTLSTVHNLGALYDDRGRLAKAEQMYARALTGREKVLGAEHATTLSTVSDLANLYATQGKLTEAEQMHLRALTGFRKTLNIQHPFAMTQMLDYAKLLTLQHKIKEAKYVYQQIIDICSGSLVNTASLSRSTGVAYAEALYRTVSISRSISPRTQCSLLSLVEHWHRRGKHSVFVTQCLVKALLHLQDDDNAQQVLLCYVKEPQDSVFDLGGTCCDACQRRLNIDMGLNVCRECVDTNLCDTCLHNDTTNMCLAKHCHHLRFYNFGDALRRTLKSSTSPSPSEVDAWLDSLKQRYRT